MGMFDSIYVDIKCPFCGEESSMECQTKDLDCVCKNYQKGDTIPEDVKHLDTRVQCLSSKCYFVPKKTEMTLSEFSAGIKRTLFDVRLFIENRTITGKYEILKEE